ncbi:CLUMA_CG018438, isoform A [Clunio marinus]|uniref:CLUMA_CG018438, isoform A n=1 Tax=Clunio marinus TaxID=568069 RepID=A0A1J1IZD2_9DIPT|nr:CLUMA_CG018438, isoform A [Clunio marinus]
MFYASYQHKRRWQTLLKTTNSEIRIAVSLLCGWALKNKKKSKESSKSSSSHVTTEMRVCMLNNNIL